jgi:hypothetical protein
MKIGTRVGAISGVTNSVARLLGYGVYEGSFLPLEATGYRALFLLEHNKKTARIRLDSGEVIYGCECIWMNENRMKKFIAPFQVETVSLTEHRLEQRATIPGESEPDPEALTHILFADFHRMHPET